MRPRNRSYTSPESIAAVDAWSADVNNDSKPGPALPDGALYCEMIRFRMYSHLFSVMVSIINECDVETSD